MNSQYLAAFVLVCELGSISAAARKLAKKPSQVSQWMTDLEADFDVPLFTRSGNRIEPSDLGLALLPEAQLAVQQLSRLWQKAQSVRQGEPLQLTIGVEQYIPMQLLAPALSRLLTFSELSLDVVSDSRMALLAGLEAEHFDLLLLLESNTLHYPVFEYCRLGRFAEVIVAAADHPLAQAGKVSAHQLSGYRELVWTRTTEDDGDEVGYSHQYAAIADYTLLEMLLTQGAGFALLPKIQVEPALQDGRLVVLKLDFEQSAIDRRVELIWRNGFAHSAIGQTALTTLQQNCLLDLS